MSDDRTGWTATTSRSDNEKLIDEARERAQFLRSATKPLPFMADAFDRLGSALEVVEAEKRSLASRQKAILDMVRSTRLAGLDNPVGWSPADKVWTEWLERTLTEKVEAAND